MIVSAPVSFHRRPHHCFGLRPGGASQLDIGVKPTEISQISLSHGYEAHRGCAWCFAQIFSSVFLLFECLQEMFWGRADVWILRWEEQQGALNGPIWLLVTAATAEKSRLGSTRRHPQNFFLPQKPNQIRFFSNEWLYLSKHCQEERCIERYIPNNKGYESQCPRNWRVRIPKDILLPKMFFDKKIWTLLTGTL